VGTPYLKGKGSWYRKGRIREYFCNATQVLKETKEHMLKTELWFELVEKELH
jgi:hypothetical protein